MPRLPEVISHWHHSVEGLSTSALDFYNSIEKSLKEKKTDVYIKRVQWHEAGVLSSKREYLRVGYGRFMFDISAFPFGQDYYFSTWLTRPSASLAAGVAVLLVMGGVIAVSVLKFGFQTGIPASLLVVLLTAFLAQEATKEGSPGLEEALISAPWLGYVYAALMKPATFYSEDSRIMFEETVQRVVVDTVSGVLTVNSMKPLTAEQKVLQSRKVIP